MFNRPTPANGSIRDYRAVVVYFHGGNRSQYIFHKEDVSKFAQAQVKLHHSPGVNPHSKLTTAPIWRITSAVLCASGPYWWTTPSLNPDGSGARFIEGGPDEEIIWEDRKYVEEQVRLEIEAEARAEAGV